MRQLYMSFHNKKNTKTNETPYRRLYHKNSHSLNNEYILFAKLAAELSLVLNSNDVALSRSSTDMTT